MLNIICIVYCMCFHAMLVYIYNILVKLRNKFIFYNDFQFGIQIRC